MNSKKSILEFFPWGEEKQLKGRIEKQNTLKLLIFF